MTEKKKEKKKKSKNFAKRLFSRIITGSVNKISFVNLFKKIATTETARHHYEHFSKMPEDWVNGDDIARLATDLTVKQLEKEGHEPPREDIEELIGQIAIQYDRDLNVDTATFAGVLFDHLFDYKSSARPFTSTDGRDLRHIDKLRAYKEEGLGVVYLINHSSHLDEFMVDLLWQRMHMGLPVFAAGQNMMVIKSLAKVLMIGSYVVLRKGASRYQMAALYNYCRAISLSGAQQGIFLEAWRGGARTRDGSLRYPKRLVTLRGAIDTRKDLVIQPIAVSFSAVPEDLPLSSRKSGISWIRGMGFFRTFFRFFIHPKTFLWRSAEDLYGRAYLSVPEPMLLSELKEKHALDKTGITLDEFTALSAIHEIARVKKIMASQLTARGLLRAGKNLEEDLLSAVSLEHDEIKAYHLSHFGEEPDFEDFIRENSMADVVADGLAMLKKRGVVHSWKKDRNGLPWVLNEIALSYYATHGDRRLYSPTADQNIVVVGAGNWGFALAALIGNRIIADRKYDNASLTIYDSRVEVADHMGLNRHGPGRFSDMILPKNVFVTSDLPSAFRKASEVIIASKPEDFEEHLREILAVSEQPLKLMLATRGFVPERNTIPYLLALRLIEEFGREDVTVFTLAAPVIPEQLVDNTVKRGILAGPKPGLDHLADLFNRPSYHLCLTEDPVGVQTADILGRVYAVWVNYVDASGRLPNATELGYLLTDVAEEVRRLALMMGAKTETFRADSIPWTASFTALCMGSPWREFGRKVGAGAKKGKKASAVFAKVEKSWVAEGMKLQALDDMKMVLECAREFGLEMPVLEEAVSEFWEA